MLTCPEFARISHIRHGFFGREGGVSEGIYASLNCAYGTGDHPAHVEENCRRITHMLGAQAGHYCKAHQVHSHVAVIATAPWPRESAPQADAIVTNVAGLVVGVTTADCVPVLFADSKNRVVAAAHAGWKGAMGGIIEATIAAMRSLGAADIIATIGPAISQASYEVGPEFYARFVAEAAGNTAFFVPSKQQNHWQFDLKSYVKMRLTESGVANINLLAHDTCLEENRFFSYRRTTRRGESSYGCQLSAIMICHPPT